jgi:hypothetical protein
MPHAIGSCSHHRSRSQIDPFRSRACGFNMHVGGFALVASFSQPFLYLEKRHSPVVRTSTRASIYLFDKINAPPRPSQPTDKQV